MCDELISFLEREIQSNEHNKELLPYRLDNLNSSRDFDEEKINIILKVNKLYKDKKLPKHVIVESLLGIISFLNKINNQDDYSLSSLSFLGFYLSDYDSDELEEFVNTKTSPNIINIISEKINSFYEECSYLDYYLGKDKEIFYDIVNKTEEERREKIGFIENASFDRGYTYEVRRI